MLIVLLFFVLIIIGYVNSPTNVDQSDIVGKYVIDREMFNGKNANWQHQHFSFEITDKDEFVFFEYYDNGKIKSVHKANVEYVRGFASPHLKINNLLPNHQVVEKEPILVRNKWDFYYVLKSQKFGNIFFTKKKKRIFCKLLH